MNKYLIEYYNIPPNERLEVVQLPNEVPDTMHLEWTAINWKNNSNANTWELLSVWNGSEASDLYHNLTRRDMRIDYNELRAVRPPTEGSTEHS